MPMRCYTLLLVLLLAACGPAPHAGGHLDNVNRAPDGELRLRALRLLMYVAAAVVAAVALERARQREAPAAG